YRAPDCWTGRNRQRHVTPRLAALRLGSRFTSAARQRCRLHYKETPRCGTCWHSQRQSSSPWQGGVGISAGTGGPSAPPPTGHRNVNTDLNTDKITEDIHRAEKKILDHANEHLQPAKDKTDKRADSSTSDATNLVPPR